MSNAAPKRRVTKVTEVEVADDEDAEETRKQWDEAPIFGELDRKRRRIELVSVRRTDPPSGYLGTMPPDVSEAKLQAKWGGGHYILEGKNDTQLVAGARRVLKIAGEPVFTSELEEAEYRRSNRLPEKGAKGPDGGGISVKDLLVMIEEKDEKRRAEQLEREDRTRNEVAEREARERKEREERSAIAAREAEERKDRERKDLEEREERRRREQREDDERRARIHREDMERMQQQAATQLAQSQQFFTQLATTLKSDTAAAAKAPGSGGEVVKAMLTGLQIARELMPGGKAEPDEKPDLLTSLVSRLPEVLQEVRETAASAYREIKGNPAPPGRALPPAGGRRPRAADELTIKGPTALKAKRVLLKLKALGKDPEKELDQMLTAVGTAIGVDQHAPVAPPAPPRSSPAPRRARPAPTPVKAAARRPPPKPRTAKPRRSRGRAA